MHTTQLSLAVPDYREASRVLIYRLGSLGDTMVALSALHLVERIFPRAERRLLSNQPVHGKAAAASAILEHSGLVHGTMSYPVGTRSPLTLASLALRIRLFRPDLLIYLTRPRGERALLRDRRFFQLACGVRRIVGLPSGTMARNLAPSKPGGLWESEAARLVRSLAMLGSCDVEDPANWDLRLTAQERITARAALAPLGNRPLLVCGPGTKMQAKDWGEHNWRSLLDRLAMAFPDHGLLLVGAQGDAAVSASASQGWGSRSLNLCGHLAPRVTAAAIAGAELYLGPDSGPMHFAAAAGVPCVIAFASRSQPGVWFPAGHGHRVIYHRLPCSNCDLETCIEHRRACLSGISVDEMFKAALQARRYGRLSSHAPRVDFPKYTPS